MRAATVKDLEESLGESLYDNGLDSDFLNKKTQKKYLKYFELKKNDGII